MRGSKAWKQSSGPHTLGVTLVLLGAILGALFSFSLLGFVTLEHKLATARFDVGHGCFPVVERRWYQTGSNNPRRRGPSPQHEVLQRYAAVAFCTLNTTVFVNTNR